jgi:hypothetical protein
VGAPQSAHIEYASRVMSALPPGLRQAVREPVDAMAVVFALLMSSDESVRAVQVQQISVRVDAALLKALGDVSGLVGGLPPEARMPLAEIAVSALRHLTPPQYATFKATVHELVAADAEVDLFEYTLERMIRRRLAPVFERMERPRVAYQALAPVLPACVDLLSCLAYWGADDAAQAQAAFAAGAAKLGAEQTLTPAPLDRCGIDLLDKALDTLALSSAPLRKRVIEAAAACISVDQRVTVEEAELLRAVGDALDCPIPPLTAGAAA